METRRRIFMERGLGFLLVSMAFDLIDGWFAARFRPDAPLAHLADRIMDKLVYSIIFPVIAVGTMWRLSLFSPSRFQLLHALFVLLLCVTVLIRDNFASFMRNFAIRQGNTPESVEYTRLRTVVAAPVAVVLYAHAFYMNGGLSSFPWTDWALGIGRLPLKSLFIIEILFLIINFGSIAAYVMKYGDACLEDISLGDDMLRGESFRSFQMHSR